jgi:hypothetical protein
MIECGLLVTQHPNEDSLVTTVYHAESGEWMQSEQVLRMKDFNNPQQLGSSLTYARRHALSSIFNLNQTDDDANEATGYQVKAVKEEMTPKHPLWKKAVDHIAKGGSISDVTDKYIVSSDNIAILTATK